MVSNRRKHIIEILNLINSLLFDQISLPGYQKKVSEISNLMLESSIFHHIQRIACRNLSRITPVPGKGFDITIFNKYLVDLIKPKITPPNPLDREITLSGADIKKIGGKYKGQQVGKYITDQIKSFESPVKSNKIQTLITKEPMKFHDLMASSISEHTIEKNGNISKNFYRPLRDYLELVLCFEEELKLDARDIIEYIALNVNMQLVNNHFMSDELVVTYSYHYSEILRNYKSSPSQIFQF